MTRVLEEVIALLFAGAVCSACLEADSSLLDRARALQGQGHHAESIEPLRTLLARDPRNVEANFLLGGALASVGEPTRAIWPLERAFRSQDSHEEAGHLLAAIYLQTGNADAAIDAANRVLESEPTNADVLRIRARANLSIGSVERASADLDRILDELGDADDVLMLKATALARSGRASEAMRFFERARAASGDAGRRQGACVAAIRFAMQTLGDPGLAGTLVDECLEGAPGAVPTLEVAIEYFDSVGAPENGTDLARAAVASAPDDALLTLLLARRLRSTGDLTGGEEFLTRAAELAQSPSLWSEVSGLHRDAGRDAAALEALDRALALGGEANDVLHFMRADLLIDLDRVAEAEAIARNVEHPAYAPILRGRILLLQGEFEGALIELTKGALEWPANPHVRLLAGLAAQSAEDFDRALSEFREAVRGSQVSGEDLVGALELARVHRDRREFAESIAFAERHARLVPQDERLEARWIVLDALLALRHHDDAMRVANLLEREGFADDALLARARVERARGKPEAAIAVIESSEVDPQLIERSDLFAELVGALTQAGREEEAIETVEAALLRFGESAPHHVIRGLVLENVGRRTEAEAAFERSIEIGGRNPVALAGLASIHESRGRIESAVALLDEAVSIDPARAEYAYAAARLALDSGATETAEGRLRAILDRHPGYVAAANDLAWLLAERGDDLDLALELVRNARKREPSFELLDTEGRVRFSRGEYDRATIAYEAALAERPDSAAIHYRLAQTLERAGEASRARDEYTAALAIGGFAEEGDARAALGRLGEPSAE